MTPKQELFEQSLNYFQSHESEILKKYHGKIVAIYIDRVLGVYDSKTAALLNVPSDFSIEAGSFIIKDFSTEQNHTARIYQSNIHF